MNGKLSTMTFLVALMLGCSCADRATKPETNDDTEERRLCAKNCDRQADCARSQDGPEIDDKMISSCVDNCMDFWFGDDRKPCHDTAIYGLTCELQAVCNNEVEPPGFVCESEKLPFSACVPDPELWANYGCTLEKCLARDGCCWDAPPPEK